jgi:hypothetical protein
VSTESFPHPPLCAGCGHRIRGTGVAAEKTKAMQDTTALQQKPAPQETMTKAEESKAMPLPGQVNDHSTTALDKSKNG